MDDSNRGCFTLIVVRQLQLVVYLGGRIGVEVGGENLKRCSVIQLFSTMPSGDLDIKFQFSENCLLYC